MPNGSVTAEQTARAFRVKAAAATEASGSICVLSGAMTSLNGILAAAGVAVGLVGLQRLLSSAYEASNATDQFNNKMKLIVGSSEGAGLALASIKDIASTLAVPLGTAQSNFSKMAASATASGFSMQVR